MDDWDGWKSALPFVTTALLSFWGGIVAYIQKMRTLVVPFSWKDLFFDLVISSFVGTLTYLLCEFSGIHGVLNSILVAISAHMGARALAKYEDFRDRILDFDGDSK